ncbi:MAG: glutamate racemase [Candidatus Omnitrophota bacterium]|nr:glutamate racemase [Candidatus Omnitrophota bacterium]
MDLASNRPIGVFDSGVGGLTVVRQLIKHLPAEDIIYFGDLANLPYGSKSRERIIRLSVAAAKFLTGFKIKLLVTACNSSSSVALATLKRRFQLPIIGVIEPGVAEALKTTVNRQVGVIGTQATIASKAYQIMLRRIDPGVKVLARSCPLFVPIVENKTDEKISLDIVRNCLKPLKNRQIDTLILGCTHYPVLKKAITRIMGDDVNLIDSGAPVALKAKVLLSETKLLAPQDRAGKIKFYVSDLAGQFRRIGRRFFGRDIPRALKVRLDV